MPNLRRSDIESWIESELKSYENPITVDDEICGSVARRLLKKFRTRIACLQETVIPKCDQLTLIRSVDGWRAVAVNGRGVKVENGKSPEECVRKVGKWLDAV